MIFRSSRILIGSAAALTVLLLLAPQASIAQWDDGGLFGDKGIGEEDAIYNEGLADSMGDYYGEVGGGLYEDYSGYYEDGEIFGEEED